MSAVSAERLRALVADLLDGRHFFALPPLVRLEWEHAPHEEVAWEVFRGQLVPPNLTRQRRTFESWNVFAVEETGRSGEPLLSLKWDEAAGELHAVRGLLCWTWEGYDSGGNVFLSREVQRWVRELVGTLQLAEFTSEGELREELAFRLFQAVIGLSRLPLTSAEAPLPGFTLSQFAYFYHPERQSCAGRSWPDLVERYRRAWSLLERTKWFEFMIRATPPGELHELADRFLELWRVHGVTGANTVALLRSMFNEIALSPYTDFVDKTLELLELLTTKQHLSIEQHVNFLGFLLRQLGRHLTAYDLVTFHHRGANYPDALLLDAVLKVYLRLLERHPALFEGNGTDHRLRRRALRMGWLLRRRYEGHPVPDAPTSPGENRRVLPLPHQRVPEEQILHLGRRKRRLYQGDLLTQHAGPVTQRVLQQSARDLEHDGELRELGMAVFIDRPLSAGKSPGEPDQTPLLSYEAFSRSIAAERLASITRDPSFGVTAEQGQTHTAHLKALNIPGQRLPASSQAAGIVSLADAARVADDVVFLRTMPGSVRLFLSCWDDGAWLRDQNLGQLTGAGPALLFRTGEDRLLLTTATGDEKVELEIDLRDGLRNRRGVEWPRAGLRTISAIRQSGAMRRD
jgi:hypothetical protein